MFEEGLSVMLRERLSAMSRERLSADVAGRLSAIGQSREAWRARWRVVEVVLHRLWAM